MSNPVKVYFSREITPEKVLELYQKLGKTLNGNVAIKVHSGEEGNPNFLRPAFWKPVVDFVGGTIVECNTAYEGPRFTTEAHLQGAKDHGFCDIAPVDIMDAEGELQLPVKDTSRLKYNIVGSHVANYDFMINLAHFKGHTMGGFGGGMGDFGGGFGGGMGGFGGF